MIFFTATLVISIIGLVGLISLKRWELSTGRVMSLSARPKATHMLARASVWVEQVAPSLLRRAAARAYRYAEVQVHRAVAYGVLLCERLLEQALQMVRYNTQVKAGDPSASAFLREVSAHKKVIQQAARDEVTPGE